MKPLPKFAAAGAPPRQSVSAILWQSLLDIYGSAAGVTIGMRRCAGRVPGRISAFGFTTRTKAKE